MVCPCELCAQLCAVSEPAKGPCLRGFAIPVEPLSYDAQLAVKVHNEASKWPAEVPLDVVRSPPLAHRLRCKFFVGEGPTGAHRFGVSNTVDGESVVKLDQEQCPVATERINICMAVLLRACDACESLRKDLHIANFLDTLSQDDMLVTLYFTGAGPPEDFDTLAVEHLIFPMKASLPGGRVSVAARTKGKPPWVASSDRGLTEAFVIEAGLFPGKKLKQAEGSFSNPNGAVTRRVNDWLVECFRALGTPTTRLLELCSGCGNHTVGLCDLFQQTLAVEIDGKLVESAKCNMELNSIDSVRVEKDDISNLPRILARAGWAPTAQGTVVLVDPPRAGLTPKTASFLCTVPCDLLVYIACGDGLERNAPQLAEGYELVRLCAADHFPFTHFLEKVAVFRPRNMP